MYRQSEKTCYTAIPPPSTCSDNMVNFGPDRFTSLGHPCKFQRISHLGSVTARHSSSGRQPNFAALNKGRHLHSAGRPSRWALAHISSSLLTAYNTQLPKARCSKTLYSCTFTVLKYCQIFVLQIRIQVISRI